MKQKKKWKIDNKKLEDSKIHSNQSQNSQGQNEKEICNLYLRKQDISCLYISPWYIKNFHKH